MFSSVIPGLRSRARDPEPPTPQKVARRCSLLLGASRLWIPACAGMTAERLPKATMAKPFRQAYL